MRRRDEVRLLVQDEDDGRHDAGLGGEAGLHELHGGGSPHSADQSLQELGEARAVPFESADEDHDEVGVGVQLGRVGDAVVDLLTPVHLLHAGADDLDGEELGRLVADVEGRVEHDVPHDGGHGQLRGVLEGRQDGLAKQAVAEHAAGEDDQHGGQPARQRVFP